MTIAASDVCRGLEENLWSLWSRFGRGDGCSLHEEHGAAWFDTPIPTLPYNAVIRFTSEHDVDRRIDAFSLITVGEAYRSCGLSTRRRGRLIFPSAFMHAAWKKRKPVREWP